MLITLEVQISNDTPSISLTMTRTVFFQASALCGVLFYDIKEDKIVSKISTNSLIYLRSN